MYLLNSHVLRRYMFQMLLTFCVLRRVVDDAHAIEPSCTVSYGNRDLAILNAMLFRCDLICLVHLQPLSLSTRQLSLCLLMLKVQKGTLVPGANALLPWTGCCTTRALRAFSLACFSSGEEELTDAKKKRRGHTCNIILSFSRITFKACQIHEVN